MCERALAAPQNPSLICFLSFFTEFFWCVWWCSRQAAQRLESTLLGTDAWFARWSERAREADERTRTLLRADDVGPDGASTPCKAERDAPLAVWPAEISAPTGAAMSPRDADEVLSGGDAPHQPGGPNQSAATTSDDEIANELALLAGELGLHL